MSVSTNLPDPLETMDAKSFALSCDPKPPLNTVTNLPKEVAGLIREVEKLYEKLVRSEGRVKLFCGLQEKKVGTAALENFLGKFLGRQGRSPEGVVQGEILKTKKGDRDEIVSLTLKMMIRDEKRDVGKLRSKFWRSRRSLETKTSVSTCKKTIRRVRDKYRSLEEVINKKVEKKITHLWNKYRTRTSIKQEHAQMLRRYSGVKALDLGGSRNRYICNS